MSIVVLVHSLQITAQQCPVAYLIDDCIDGPADGALLAIGRLGSALTLCRRRLAILQSPTAEVSHMRWQ